MVDVIATEPTQQTPDALWIQWHKDLKSVLGKKTANSVFLQFWEKRGSPSANTNALRTYAESQGITIEGGILSGITDAAYSVVDKIGDVFKIGEYATIAVIVVVVGGLGMLLFNIAKQPMEAVKAASAGAASGAAA